MRGEAEPSPTIGLVATLSVVLIGALGGIMPSLQPLLLGRLAMEGAIQSEGIGRLAMAEALGMAGTVGLAGIFLTGTNLRWIAGGAARRIQDRSKSRARSPAAALRSTLDVAIAPDRSRTWR